MSGHLQQALESLHAERSNVEAQHKRLAARLQMIDQGIESLSHLLADTGEIASPVPTSGVASIGEDDIPLWRILKHFIDLHGPMKPRELAERVLEAGYQTNSKDFPNVVGTNLRAMPDMFVKRDDGRWDTAL
jgi:hypothetical protein